MIDSSESHAVEEVIECALAAQRRVLLVGFKPRVEPVLTKLGVIELVGQNARFRDRLSALQQAASSLGQPGDETIPSDYCISTRSYLASERALKL